MKIALVRSLPLLFLTACAHAASGGPTTPDPICASGGEMVSVADRFDAALRDAEHAEPSDVRDDLIVLSPDTPGLRVRQGAGGPEVLVATWTEGRYYEAALHGTMELTHDPVWVTTTPEIQRACSAEGRGCESPRQRLRELLGLRPETDHADIVEFWVEIARLVRPCPDPEVSDSVCGLGAPADVPFPPTSYPAWFEDLRGRSYLPATGYPWTRLGYTYDWGPSGNHRGASEFVVPLHTVVTIEAITPVDAYCGR